MISSFQDIHRKQDKKTIQLQEDPEWMEGQSANYWQVAITVIVG
jgi:hypothetical protein